MVSHLRNTGRLGALFLCLTLTACAHSTPPLTPPIRPSLDSALAAPCPAVAKPDAPDYDVWQLWMIDLLHQYADCAARHAKTVQAWPK